MILPNSRENRVVNTKQREKQLNQKQIKIKYYRRSTQLTSHTFEINYLDCALFVY